VEADTPPDFTNANKKAQPVNSRYNVGKRKPSKKEGNTHHLAKHPINAKPEERQSY
jgi:hypothetical protein